VPAAADGGAAVDSGHTEKPAVYNKRCCQASIRYVMNCILPLSGQYSRTKDKRRKIKLKRMNNVYNTENRQV